MTLSQDPNEIRRLAKLLDDAVEARDIDTVLSCFTDDCEVEFLEIKVKGTAALKRAIEWMYDRLGRIRFEPVVILVEGEAFFEEFVMICQAQQQPEIKLKATEVLIYEDYKVKSLRLYLDRLSLAEAFARGFFEKTLVGMVSRAFSKEMTQLLK